MNGAALQSYVGYPRRMPAPPVRNLTVKARREPKSLSADDLASLVLAIAGERDREAFACLFGHFAPRVKAYLMRTGTPADKAEELAQETMLSVWRKATSFDAARAGAATWIFTIARNLRIDAQRRERVRVGLPEPTPEADDSPTPEEQLLAMTRDERVRAALAGLSEEQRTVINLSFFAEKPHSEIARDLGLPLGTVKSRMRLAFARLRGLLEEAP